MISVVIPALNEQDAIGETVATASRVLTKAKLQPFEIIVVDDGSSDETGARAAKEGASVIRHPSNAGYGRSLKDGIQAAKYDTIVITDADGTYPLDAIPALVEHHRQGFDMTVGSRSGKHYRQSLMKMPLRWLLRRLVEFVASRPIPDINSGLRVFNKNTVVQYFNRLCDTFSFTTSLTLAYMMTGRFVSYVPIEYSERIGETKVRLLKDSLRTFQYVLEAAIYYNPLRIFFLASVIVAAGSFLSFAIAYFSRLNVFFFLGIGSLILSVMVLCVGLLAVLLRQIMVESSELAQSQTSRIEKSAFRPVAVADADDTPGPAAPSGIEGRQRRKMHSR